MENIDFNAAKTNYASAQRSNMEIVKDQYKIIENAELVDKVFAKIPLMFQILNNDRQIIYINERLEKDLDRKKINNILGYRIGEVYSCENAFLEKGGCGTSKNCKHCGIINTIIEAKNSNNMVTHEALFETEIDGKKETTNYNVSAKPFFWQNQHFMIVSFENISEKKRKEQLERTFFHDLMNKVSSISGLSELLEMEDNSKDNQFVQMIKRGIYDLTDEIRFQHNLSNAEKGELLINNTDISSLELLQQMKENFLPFYSFSQKGINIDQNSVDITFKSDKVLINRILNNLIKNSLEAITKKETVSIGTKQTGDHIQFWVKNNVVLSDEVKHKIFKRSFSTKGAGRGIGTYSVKLFTENFLNGKTYFTSDPKNGTIFYVEFPITKDH